VISVRAGWAGATSRLVNAEATRVRVLRGRSGRLAGHEVETLKSS
jgi:hypothetical protein